MHQKALKILQIWGAHRQTYQDLWSTYPMKSDSHGHPQGCLPKMGRKWGSGKTTKLEKIPWSKYIKTCCLFHHSSFRVQQCWQGHDDTTFFKLIVCLAIIDSKITSKTLYKNFNSIPLLTKVHVVLTKSTPTFIPMTTNLLEGDKPLMIPSAFSLTCTSVSQMPMWEKIWKKKIGYKTRITSKIS